jgi:hypothetical protein
MFASPFTASERRLLDRASEFVLFESLTISRRHLARRLPSSSFMRPALYGGRRWVWLPIALLADVRTSRSGLLSICLHRALKWREKGHLGAAAW